MFPKFKEKVKKLLLVLATSTLMTATKKKAVRTSETAEAVETAEVVEID